MPDIVYVDDACDAFLSHATAEEMKRIESVDYDAEAQDEPDAAKARAALVWLFDFFLVEQAQTGRRDENGLSLFQKWKAEFKGRPTTVVVSNALEAAVGRPLGPVHRHHVIAQRHGVEWIGDKSRETLSRVVQLADAAAAITASLSPSPIGDGELGTYDAERLAFEVLELPRDTEWATNAQRQIDRARPPREVPTTSGPATARSIIAWLLAHVLPYPSFLLSDAQAALRLRIRPASFRELVEAIEKRAEKSPHADLLKSSLYRGPLSRFLGRRWWRAAIDDFAWNLAEAADGMGVAMDALAGDIKLERLAHAEPVLVSDSDLVETDEVADAEECVRVTDEDFPANVEPAWVRIETARQDRLVAAKVVYEDRDLLSPAA